MRAVTACWKQEKQKTLLPEHGAERTQRGEAAGGDLAQLDVTNRVSAGTAADGGRRDQTGPLHLRWLQLGPAPQQLRLHQLGVDGGPVRHRLTARLRTERNCEEPKIIQQTQPMI